MKEFQDQLERLAESIAHDLQAQPQAEPTAWELKLRLKAPLSHIYMALGILTARGQVRLRPEGLNYHVIRSEASAAGPTAL